MHFLLFLVSCLQLSVYFSHSYSGTGSTAQWISRNPYYYCDLSYSRLIRLSSPNLNYIIGLGAIVLYLNVITLVIPTTNPDFAAVLCNVSTTVCLPLSVFIINDILTDQSVADISGILSVLWHHSGQDNQDLVHIQQASCSFSNTISMLYNNKTSTHW